MRVCVTGGTGSLGRAITRHALRHSEDVVIVFSRSELAQAEFHQSLVAEFGAALVGGRARFCLGDIRDPDRLHLAFRGADVVIHAAALKRVDAVATHADETVKTNILGSLNVFRAAMDCGVPKVLLISSDKAVMPTNSYGASKQMAEWVATGFNTYSVPAGTRIAAIRYGNVLGSRGSVIHIWRKALREGRRLPLTSPDATRFVITMDHAIECIYEALEVMQGGEIFVPFLPWCYVTEIAKAMNGVVEVIGLRAGGEKVHESLLSTEERYRCAETERSWVVLPHIRSWGVKRDWTRVAPHMVPEYYSGNPAITPMVATDLKPLIEAIPEDGLF